MGEFIAKYWLEFAFGLIISAITISYRWLAKKIKKQKCEQVHIQTGIRVLLWDRLHQGYKYHTSREWISIDDLKAIEELYHAYTALGGNGTGSELYERLKRLPPVPINCKIEDGGSDYEHGTHL
jgi:hypothetical protein